MVVVKEVQGLEDNVHQLDCDGLALTLILALVATNQWRRQTLLDVKGSEC